MSEDDIDIEEHDVFDNPNLQKIFPDLSIIKKELIQYEEGLNASSENTLTQGVLDSPSKARQNEHPADKALQDPPLESQKSNKPLNNKLEVHLRFKNFLDSLADDVIENSDVNSDTESISENFNHIDNLSSPQNLSEPENETFPHVSEAETPCKDVKLLRNNIFILGSKPSVNLKKTCADKKQPKLVIKNINYYLNACGRYCHHCRILFPSVAAFHHHTKIFHCLTASNSSVRKKEHLGSKTSVVKFQCHICKTDISSKGNLRRHIKRIHKKVPYVDPGNIISEPRTLRKHANKTPSSSDTKITENKLTQNHNCFHCTKIFETRSALIEHLYEVITPNKNELNSSQNNDTHSKVQDAIIDKNNKNVNKSKKSHREPANKYHTRSHKASNNKTGRSLVNVPMETEELKLVKNDKFLVPDKNKQNANKISNDKTVKSAVNVPMQTGESKLVENIKFVFPDKNKQNKQYANKMKLTAKINEPDIDKDSPLDYINEPDHESSIHSESDNERDAGIEHSSLFITKKEMYQCFVCSQYIVHMKRYARHMLGHNIKEVSDAAKVLFVSPCEFCTLKLSSTKVYNEHIVKSHPEKFNKKLKMHDKSFNSVLFKCVKCDVFFLSANAAMNHSEHESIFLNWKCSDCQRLFKIKDKALHLKQHSLSKIITAYVLRESALNRVLFKCFKCAVHFSEKEYFLHYATCDLELPNSAYCKTCDILINKTDMGMHEHSHKDKNLQSLEFTFIESDIIHKEKKIHEKNNPHAKSKFALTFCSFCNCFVGDMGRKRKAHVEGRCGIIHPRMCRQCGLIFTSRGYVTHKMLHDKVEKLQLQTFYFYDIKSKKQMNPPIPKYPNCNICEVHFLNKQAIINHVCSQQTFQRCKTCNIKLTDAAYNLHMNFHNYKLSSSALNRKQRISLKLKEPISTSTSSASTSAISTEQESLLTKIAEDTDMPNLRYTCIICDITFNMYDEVVQHCHEHYDLEIRVNDQNKNKSDEKETFAVTIKFDPFYIRYDSKVWQRHIFANLAVAQIQSILDNSIYKYECRLKLEQIQSGPYNLALYKCDTCRSYIDPDDLYSHASIKCVVSKKFPCSSCGLCFYSQSYRMVHEKIHDVYDVNISSYKILLFNKREYLYFNQIMIDAPRKFILYQCRNCEAIVEKLQHNAHHCCKDELTRCSHCKLLFHKLEFSSHVDKHNEFTDFKPEHMVVIMFGKSGFQKYGTLKSTFGGTIHDLTFYKCISCGLCLTTKDHTRKHCCISRSNQAQCPKCYLCFKTKDLQEHLNLHDNNLELVYDDFNSNIITFNVSTAKVKPNNAKEITSETSEEIDSIAESDDNQVNKDLETTQQLYKCPCGLHFLEINNAKKHNESCMPKMKLSRQNCFKCNLLFTPGELFNHLLQHHGDKNVKYKYDIITVSDA